MKKWEDLPASMKNSNVKKYYNILQRKKVSLFFKRLFDMMFSLIGLIVLSPLFLILAAVIKIDSKGPVFFRQERVTRYDKTFKILKFRTMIQGAEEKGALITSKGDKRITRVGKAIRKIRLDEVPQLINVLKGDMSFVGTRPEVKKYVDKYTDEMKATLLMRAGVTSIASIYFRDEDKIINKFVNKKQNVDNVYIDKVLPIKMKYNLRYIKEFNVLHDLRVVYSTALTVLGLKRPARYSEGQRSEI